MSDEAPITYRLRGPRANESELGFVMNSWLKSLALSRSVEDKAAGYYEAQKLAIASLLEGGRIVVACSANDPDAIYGYGVGAPGKRGPMLHWVYVKQGLRKKGIGAAIALELGADIYAEPPKPWEPGMAPVPRGPMVTITSCTGGWIRARARHLCWGISEFAPLYAAINYNARKAG